jgi:ethanolamine phosphate phosphodiesterase
MTLFNPDVVVILGDVFDEGHWVDDKSFDEYVQRFKSTFYVPSSTRLYAIHGNFC